MAALPDSSAAIEPRLRVREGMHISFRVSQNRQSLGAALLRFGDRVRE